MFKHIIRGGQTAMHATRMVAQIFVKLMLLGLLLYVVIASCYIYQKTIRYQWYLLYHYQVALLKFSLFGAHSKHIVIAPNGTKVIMSSRQFIYNRLLQQQLNHLLAIVSKILAISLKITLVSLVLIIILLRRKGRMQIMNKGVRGALFLQAKELKKFLKKQQQCSDLHIAGVPLIKNSETKHILITGTTGSGKSISMMELMDQIRKRKQRAIVYDNCGTFIQHYYRKSKDIILNPLDERCPSWNIWQETADLADLEAIAASLMPTHILGSDPFWVNSARTIFAALATKLKDRGKSKNGDLLQLMFSSDLKLIGEILKGTVAETLVAESLDKMALSIKSTLATYCKSLLYLKEEQEPLFSIKGWLQNEKADSWIFIATNAEKLEALKPLISVWLDIAARGILSLPQSAKRRIWFLIDELASLHRLNSLPLLLSEARKFGGAVVTAFQDLHQLRAIYGRDEAEALLSMYNTNLCYRTKCPDTAHWMSRLTGQRELIEQREGYSYGANDIRDGVSVHQEQRKEPLVLDIEFLNLNDHEAYLVLPGNMPVTKVTLTPIMRPIKAKPLIARTLTADLLSTNVVSANNEKTIISNKQLVAKPINSKRKKPAQLEEVEF